jgi:hypothetical protein
MAAACTAVGEWSMEPSQCSGGGRILGVIRYFVSCLIGGSGGGGGVARGCLIFHD